MTHTERTALLAQIKKNNRRINRLKLSVSRMLKEIFATIKQQSLLFAEMKRIDKGWKDPRHVTFQSIAGRVSLDKAALQALGILPAPLAKPKKSKGLKPASPLLEAGKALNSLLSLSRTRSETELIKTMIDQTKGKL